MHFTRLPIILVWPYALAFWLAVVWAMYPEVLLARRSRNLAGPQDAGSMKFLMAVQRVAMAATFGLSFQNIAGALPRPRLCLIIGIAMILAGGLLRRHCFRMLGPSFTAAVVVAPGQTIVDRGAYRWVRHPSYTAGALLLFGMAVALGNWISIAIVAAAIILTYTYRVRVEESALLTTLGQPYRDYMQRTRRFVPGVI